MEFDMSFNFKCYPSFDDMDFYEFVAKYEKLNNRLKENKTGSKGMVDLFQHFKQYLGNNG